MNAGESAFLRTRNAGKLAFSKRSGGPRSEAGKAASSKNSIKTGIYSAQVVLPGERPEEFQELEQCFVDDFRPEGITESQMVHDLAVITWKKRRLNRIEHAVIMGQLQASITAEEFFEAGLPRRDGFKWALENQSCLTQENLELYERHAELAKGMGREEVRAERIAEIKKNAPDLFKRLERLVFDCMEADESRRHEDIPPMLKLNLFRRLTRGRPIEDMVDEMAPFLELEIIKQAEGLRYVMNHVDEINTIRQIVKDKRHLGLVGADGQSRAMDDLNRAFYRTLKELRTHQEWGRRHRVIDVSPE